MIVEATFVRAGNAIRVRVDSERFVDVHASFTALYQKRYDDESRQRNVKREDPSETASSKIQRSSTDIVDKANRNFLPLSIWIIVFLVCARFARAVQWLPAECQGGS